MSGHTPWSEIKRGPKPVMICPICGITVEDEAAHQRIHDAEHWHWTPRRVFVLAAAIAFIVLVTGMGIW